MSSSAWLAVAESEEVGRHLLACEAGKLRLVVFRRRDGQPVALDDECWHRLLPLSNGRLEDDNVVCAYHGLVFGSDGQCLRARIGPAPTGAAVRCYPARDAAGFVWVEIRGAEFAEQAGSAKVGVFRSTLP